MKEETSDNIDLLINAAMQLIPTIGRQSCNIVFWK